MGRIYTPKYRIEYRDQNAGFGWRMLSYDSKRFGEPTDAKAEEIRQSYNRSFAPGGVNFHASEAAGYVVHVSRLRIIQQKTGKVVAEAVAPMFEVVRGRSTH